MAKISAKRIKDAGKILKLAGEDAIPADGTAGQRFACTILEKFGDLVDDVGELHLTTPDVKFINQIVEACQEKLQPKR